MLSKKAAGCLLDDLCVKLGFCLPAEKRELLLASPPANATEFAATVIAMEGINIETMDRDLRRQVQALVSAAFSV
jgi:hypothetical protein